MFAVVGFGGGLLFKHVANHLHTLVANLFFFFAFFFFYVFVMHLFHSVYDFILLLPRFFSSITFALASNLSVRVYSVFGLHDL